MLLEARDLTVKRTADDRALVVLDRVDIALEAGTLTDLTGPSGAGKTTLLLALARLLPDASGDLTLDGEPAASVEPRAWRARVAYLPQRPSLVPGTVADNLLLPWRLRVRHGHVAPGAHALREALDGVGLGDVALDRDVQRLSVGQSARVALLRCVLVGARVLLLDEPDASLDDESAAQVARMTAAFVGDGGAVLRVRHARVDESCDRRLRLSGGRLTEAAADA